MLVVSSRSFNSTPVDEILFSLNREHWEPHKPRCRRERSIYRHSGGRDTKRRGGKLMHGTDSRNQHIRKPRVAQQAKESHHERAFQRIRRAMSRGLALPLLLNGSLDVHPHAVALRVVGGVRGGLAVVQPRKRVAFGVEEVVGVVGLGDHMGARGLDQSAQGRPPERPLPAHGTASVTVTVIHSQALTPPLPNRSHPHNNLDRQIAWRLA